MSTTIDKSVRQALRAAVIAVSGLPAEVGYENIAFAPASNVSWMREARLSGMPRHQANIGSTAVTNHVFADFLYEVHFGAPKLEGPEELEAYAGLLLSALRPGIGITVEGATLRVVQGTRSSILYPDEYPGHAVIACTFTLSSIILNT